MPKPDSQTTKKSRAKAHVTVHIYGFSKNARYYTIKYKGRRIGGQFETSEAVDIFLKQQGIEASQ